MTLPSYAVTFRGLPACPCQAEWIPRYERELQRRGLLGGLLHIYQLIGGNPSSGGTHTEGGADDTEWVSSEALWVSRQMGADATWHRPFNWDGAGGIEHVHRVLRSCPHNGPARYQIDAVDAGFNGLGHLGQGAPDDGPRPLSGRTWREGIAWAQQQEDNVTPEDLDKIIAAVKASVPTTDEIVEAVLAAEVRKATKTQNAVSARRAWRESFEAVEK